VKLLHRPACFDIRISLASTRDPIDQQGANGRVCRLARPLEERLCMGMASSLNMRVRAFRPLLLRPLSLCLSVSQHARRSAITHPLFVQCAAHPASPPSRSLHHTITRFAPAAAFHPSLVVRSLVPQRPHSFLSSLDLRRPDSARLHSL